MVNFIEFERFLIILIVKICNNLSKNPKVFVKSAVIHGTGTKKGLKKMGMAASQARLLTLTARIHDVEYMAQSIQNAKLALATQQDRVYQEYLDALDEKTFTVRDNNGEVKIANFNTLCGIDAVKASRLERYTLRDDRNRIIVADDVARGYEKFGRGGDAYAFALFMMNGMNGEAFQKMDNYYLTAPEMEVFEAHETANDFSSKVRELITTIEDNILKICDYCSATDKEALLESVKNDKTLFAKISTMRDTYKSAFSGDAENEEMYAGAREHKNEIEKSLSLIEKCFEQIQYNMYTAYGEEIYGKAFDGASDYDDSDFWYYVNLYKQIEANGGSIVSIDDFNGLEGIGNASTDTDWLKRMVESGQITIDIATMNKKDGKISFASTSVPSDTNLEYTTTSTVDSTKLAKAQAKYEHEMKKIDQKDKKFDMDLSKLETQRSALTKEYDSVKKVASENIERTFGIFS